MAERRKAKPSRLGEILVAHGLITREQRRHALLQQKQSDKRLGEILIEDGVLTRDELNWALGNLLGVPYIELDATMVDREVFRSVPIELLRRYRAVPMIQAGGEVTVAMADPTDTQAIADMGAVTGAEVKLAMADAAAVEETLDALAAERPARRGRRIELPPARKRAPSTEELLADASGALLIQHHLRAALRQGADEILFQPAEDSFRVRYHVHGSLTEGATYPASFLPVAITRLKLMANLAFEGGARFQEGQLTLDVGGRALDILASVYATVHGPAARIEFRAKRSGPLPLAKLGFGKPALASLRRAARAAAGLIVACGPRHSGTSTTLYALLAEAALPGRHAVTLEATTACRYPDATQLEIPYGHDYLGVLRKLMERPPDAILVEGLHDRGLWAAVGPQAVTSTLLLGEMRAEDALAALGQLRENGVGGAVLGASLRLIVAQRLVPRLDPQAREMDTPSAHALDRITALVPDAAAAQYHRAKTGPDGHKLFRGLELVYELLEPDDAMRDLLAEGAPVARLREACERAGMVTLRECAIAKAARGLIELEEAV